MTTRLVPIDDTGMTPDGKWRLVPVTPTREMVDIGRYQSTHNIEAIYFCMGNAAPPPNVGFELPESKHEGSFSDRGESWNDCLDEIKRRMKP